MISPNSQTLMIFNNGQLAQCHVSMLYTPIRYFFSRVDVATQRLAFEAFIMSHPSIIIYNKVYIRVCYITYTLTVKLVFVSLSFGFSSLVSQVKRATYMVIGPRLGFFVALCPLLRKMLVS